MRPRRGLQLALVCLLLAGVAAACAPAATAVPAPTTARVTARPKAARLGAAHTHVVRAGETLAGLARRYGVSIQALREANGLSEDAMLKRGARLKIPA